jgi:uncharacterized phage-like protein YoqJ
MKTLAFTGHRPKDLGGYDEDNPTALKVQRQLRTMIIQAYESGYRTFITGMAMGVDQWAGHCVADLKPEHPDIKLIAAIPFVSQPTVWTLGSRASWQVILSNCDEIYVVDTNPNEIISMKDVLRDSKVPSEDPKYLISKKLNDRNKWMVDRADCMLAVWRHTKGGTGNCVEYAISKGKTVIAYNPDDDSVVKL